MEIQVKLNIPDELLKEDGAQVSRRVFEQFVAEGYNSGRLTYKQVRNLLGFSTRFEVDEFLHDYGVYGYTVEDLREDLQTLRDLGLR